MGKANNIVAEEPPLINQIDLKLSRIPKPKRRKREAIAKNYSC